MTCDRRPLEAGGPVSRPRWSRPDSRSRSWELVAGGNVRQSAEFRVKNARSKSASRECGASICACSRRGILVPKFGTPAKLLVGPATASPVSLEPKNRAGAPSPRRPIHVTRSSGQGLRVLRIFFSGSGLPGSWAPPCFNWLSQKMGTSPLSLCES